MRCERGLVTDKACDTTGPTSKPRLSMEAAGHSRSRTARFLYPKCPEEAALEPADTDPEGGCQGWERAVTADGHLVSLGDDGNISKIRQWSRSHESVAALTTHSNARLKGLSGGVWIRLNEAFLKSEEAAGGEDRKEAPDELMRARRAQNQAVSLDRRTSQDVEWKGPGPGLSLLLRKPRSLERTSRSGILQILFGT